MRTLWGPGWKVSGLLYQIYTVDSKFCPGLRVGQVRALFAVLSRLCRLHFRSPNATSLAFILSAVSIVINSPVAENVPMFQV